MVAEDEQKLWELYVVDCEAKGLHPNVRDYVIWKAEEYGEVED